VPAPKGKLIPADALLQLRQRLDRLPPKSAERAAQIASVADLYGVSAATVYRALQRVNRPHATHRADHGKPRVLQPDELERYCELVAALKLRTTNKQGRHLSTQRAIELLEEHGVETTEGLVKAPPGVLHRPTVNRYLALWHLDLPHLRRPPPVVRFQAEQSNDCWQFDLSPSDLKHIERPEWVDPAKGPPTLMLFSVVDDRSGVAYQEYRCVYGEDVESGLRFLFNAIAAKADAAFALQGRPKMLYLDNGPIAKARVFHNVMKALGIDWVLAGRIGLHDAVPQGLVAVSQRVTIEDLRARVQRRFFFVRTSARSTVRRCTARSKCCSMSCARAGPSSAGSASRCCSMKA
jgi:hypothetical protein